MTSSGLPQPGLRDSGVAMAPDFWTPLAMVEQLVHDPGRLTNRNTNWLLADGRLKKPPEQATKSAQAEMSVLARKELELVSTLTRTKIWVKHSLLSSACSRPIPRLCDRLHWDADGRIRFGARNSLHQCRKSFDGEVNQADSGDGDSIGVGSQARTIDSRQMTVESLLLSLIAGCSAVLLRLDDLSPAC